MSGKVDRLASRLSDWIQILAFSAGLVIAVVGGVFRFIQEFSIFWRILFWVCFIGLMVSLFSRMYLGIRAAQERRRLALASSDLTSHSGFVLADISGGTNVTVSDARMFIGSSANASVDLPIDNSPKTLSSLKDGLREQSQVLYEFWSDRELSRPILEKPSSVAMMAAGIPHAEITAKVDEWFHRNKDQTERYELETTALYNQRMDGRVFYLFDEARRRGYAPEFQAQDAILHHSDRIRVREIARWLWAISERIQFDPGQ